MGVDEGSGLWRWDWIRDILYQTRMRQLQRQVRSLEPILPHPSSLRAARRAVGSRMCVKLPRKQATSYNALGDSTTLYATEAVIRTKRRRRLHAMRRLTKSRYR